MILWALAVLILGVPVVSLAGYVIHFCLHHPWLGPFHRSHMAHHTVYPENDFLSDKYREVGKDSTVWPFLAVGLILAGIGAWLTPWWLWVPLAIDAALVGYLSDKVHEYTHVPSWLEKLKVFHYLRAKHVIHHVDPKTNYGILGFTFDKIFGTFR